MNDTVAIPALRKVGYPTLLTLSKCLYDTEIACQLVMSVRQPEKAAGKRILQT